MRKFVMFLLVLVLSCMMSIANAESVDTMTVEELESYITQLLDILEQKKVEAITPSKEDLVSADWTDYLADLGEKQGFDVPVKSLQALKKYSLYFSGEQQADTPSAATVNQFFNLAYFKKLPEAYCDRLIKLSDLTVVQVTTHQYNGMVIEEMTLWDIGTNLMYQGYHLGTTDIVEGMKVEAYVLPLDWATFKNSRNQSGWAVYCAITDFVYESHKTLQYGDQGDDVLKMKLRMQELGYYSVGASFSDLFNNICVERLKMFQAANGLPVTGVADCVTLERLFSVDALCMTW